MDQTSKRVIIKHAAYAAKYLIAYRVLMHRYRKLAESISIRDIRKTSPHRRQRAIIFGSSPSALKHINVIKDSDFVISLNSSVFLNIRKDIALFECPDSTDTPEWYASLEQKLRYVFSNNCDFYVPKPDLFVFTNLKPRKGVYNIKDTSIRPFFLTELPWISERWGDAIVQIETLRSLGMMNFGLPKIRSSLSRAIFISIHLGIKEIIIIGCDGKSKKYFWEAQEFVYSEHFKDLSIELLKVISSDDKMTLHRTHDVQIGPMTIPNMVKLVETTFPDMKIQLI
jgi:hypothetical protein